MTNGESVVVTSELDIVVVAAPGLSGVSEQERRRQAIESRREAAVAVGVLAVLQLLLALVSWRAHWRLGDMSEWIWVMPVPLELGLIAALSWSLPHRVLEQVGTRLRFTREGVAAVGVANTILLVAVVASLTKSGTSGRQLLLEGIALWLTNVVSFGVWFWSIDRGGPILRCSSCPGEEDFRFPQMEGERAVVDERAGWAPQLVDYIYVSFTNSIAFSPTDAMPLTPRAKLSMLAESAISVVTVLVVTARAVNIFH